MGRKDDTIQAEVSAAQAAPGWICRVARSTAYPTGTSSAGRLRGEPQRRSGARGETRSCVSSSWTAGSSPAGIRAAGMASALGARCWGRCGPTHACLR